MNDGLSSSSSSSASIASSACSLKSCASSHSYRCDDTNLSTFLPSSSSSSSSSTNQSPPPQHLQHHASTPRPRPYRTLLPSFPCLPPFDRALKPFTDVELTPFRPPQIPHSPTPPHPITCTLYTPDLSFTTALDFPLFSRWTHFAALLRAWGDELGVGVDDSGIFMSAGIEEEVVGEEGRVQWCIWNAHEGMCVQAGDWEARARPGWSVSVFDVRCLDAGDGGGDYGAGSGESTRSYEVKGDEESVWKDLIGMRWDVEKGGDGEVLEEKREEWWFARWRRDVEHGGGGGGRGGGWMVGMVGLVGVLGAFWVVLGLVGEGW